MGTHNRLLSLGAEAPSFETIVATGANSAIPHHRPDSTELRAMFSRVVRDAFGQRRKTLRASLKGIAGTGEIAEEALRAAGIDPRQRGEKLAVADFVRLAGLQ